MSDAPLEDERRQRPRFLALARPLNPQPSYLIHGTRRHGPPLLSAFATRKTGPVRHAIAQRVVAGVFYPSKP